MRPHKGDILHDLLYSFLLFLLVWAAYSQALSFDLLIWDDLKLVTRNPLIHGRSPGDLLRIFDFRNHLIPGALPEFYPVRDLLYAGLFSLFKDDPLPYHAANLAIHSLCAALVFLLAGRLGIGRIWALFAASVFALHPLNTEAVCWIAETKTLLAAFFLLVSFHLHMSYARAASWPARGFFYTSSFVVLVLAILSKASAVTGFLILIVYDLFAAGRRDILRLLAEKLPHALVSVTLSWIMYLGFAANGGWGEYPGGSILTSLMTSTVTLGKFFVKLLFPYETSVRYVTEAVLSPLEAKFVFSILFWFLVVGAAMMLFKKTKLPLFYILLFFTQALPTSNVLRQTLAEADRWFYVHTIFCAVVGAAAIEALFRRFAEKPAWRMIIPGTAVILVALSGRAASTRSWVFENEETLWNSVLGEHPSLTAAYVNLADYYGNKGDEARMFETARAAMHLKNGGSYPPALATLNSNIGFHLIKKGNRDEARKYFETALGILPSHLNAHLGLGILEKDEGGIESARTHFEKALSGEPLNPTYILHMGTVFEEMKDYPEALSFYFRSIAADPYFSGGYTAATRLLMKLGKEKEARKVMKEGIEYIPSSPALRNLAKEIKEAGP